MTCCIATPRGWWHHGYRSSAFFLRWSATPPLHSTIMEKLKTLLIANRGEIAVRIVKTARTLGIHTVSIYTAADAASAHVGAADEAVLLTGPESKAYTDGEQIVQIAKSKNVDAVIPGYGFLSENIDFARHVRDAGMVFVGPSPKCIEDFGIKHTARALAAQADVPIVPGTIGLVHSADEAVVEAKKLGFPVAMSSSIWVAEN